MGCDRAPFEDLTTHERDAARCDRCGGKLRPDVVLFKMRLDPSSGCPLSLRESDEASARWLAADRWDAWVFEGP